jgi:hypothetical protein
MTANKLEFMMENGNVVGSFRGDVYPNSAGEYQYEPYRGPGHFELQTHLKSGPAPRCYYAQNGKKISFTVVGCAEYGTLELRDFKGAEIA